MLEKSVSYRDKFRDSAESYDKTTQTKHISLIYDLEKEVLDNFFARIGAKQLSVMDFACGSGRWTSYLETKFNTTIGLDISPAMIDLAKSKCSKANFIVGDITDISAEFDKLKQEFDVITAFRFFKNAEEPLREEAVNVIPNYLKESGYLILDLHLNTYSFMGILANVIKLFKIDRLFDISSIRLKTISLYEIKRLFNKVGLEIVDYWGMGVLPGRSDSILLPLRILYMIEHYFTKNKILRLFSYNILIIAKKVS